MSDQDGGPKLTTSDEALVEQTRAGDQRAYAELWRRHFRSGVRVAHQFTSSIDADDLVSEAYTRIYQRVLAGGGPTGAFRPYLFTTIRNLASTWGAARKDVQVDDIADFEDPTTLDDPAAVALDRTLTARAFRTLPDRWQSVLWYTEVEGMDPHEVAPIMGMTANGVAALSYRAREGLRKAWLQAHINDATASGECQWTISKLGDHARRGLSNRDRERMTDHLATCAKCAIINEEVDEVGSRLALVMIPLLLGGVAGGAYLASFGTASSSVQAAASIPALPEAITAGGAATVGAVGLFGAATTPILVGTLALVVAAGGGAVVATQDDPIPETLISTSAEGDPSAAEDDRTRPKPTVQAPIVPTDAQGSPPTTRRTSPAVTACRRRRRRRGRRSRWRRGRRRGWHPRPGARGSAADRACRHRDHGPRHPGCDRHRERRRHRDRLHHRGRQRHVRPRRQRPAGRHRLGQHLAGHERPAARWPARAAPPLRLDSGGVLDVVFNLLG